MQTFLNLIKHCPSMQELEFFLQLPFYLANRQYWFAIRNRNNELIREDRMRHTVLTDAFWNAMPPDYLDSQVEVDEAPAEEPDELWLPAQQWQHGGAPAVDNPANFYILGEPQVRNLPNFHTEAHTRTIRFQNLDQADDIGAVVAAAFDEILDEAAGDDPRAMIGITLHHPALDTPLTLPFSRRSQISGEVLLREVERLQQSATAVSLDEQMRIEVTRITPPAGSGHRSWDFRGVWQPWFERHGGCFIPIKNRDHLCCARTIVTAKARLHKNESKEARSCYETLRKGDLRRGTAQHEAARQLMQAAGLQDFKEACGLPELKKLQQAIGPDYQIKVFWKENFDQLFFEGPAAARIIHLYLHHNHFDVITSVAAFFNQSYYCDECNKKYSNKDGHKCKKRCYACNRIGRDHPCSVVDWVHCNDCHRHFPSQQCFDAHKKKTTTTIGRGAKRQKIETSVCKRVSCCPRCHKMINERHQKGEKHRCGQTYCTNCKRYCVLNHKCCIQPIEEPKNDEEKAPKFIFFDFECQTMDTVVGENANGQIFEHVPNLCVVQRACDKCKNEYSPNKDCPSCGSLQKVFRGAKCKEEFCNWLFSAENKGCIAIAHNAKGYDSQFLLQHLHEQAVKPDIVLTGRKVIVLKACGIKVIDSLNFLPMPLEGFPKAFGLSELKKGFFPHGFNRQTNEGYIGDWPPLEDYWPKLMKAEKRARLEKWYAEQSGKQFDFDKELLDYCISDVTLLREGCLKFRQQFLESTQVDPFVKATTIASACNYVYRRNFLQPDTIGLIPDGGYRREAKQSVIALKWLKWQNETLHLNIQHALNGGEVRLGPYLVDGLDRTSNTVYEFNGCAWHGCLHCFPKRDKKLPNGLTAEESFERTLSRRQNIEAQGYTVVEMWGCELNRHLLSNPEMKRFFKDQQLNEPLDPREAFYGGRTNATKLYHKCEADEKIEYKDVVSLYPWINKYGAFPTGHPIISTEGLDATDITTRRHIKGLIKCRVLPPRGLLHPLLPCRSNGKLCFPLCGCCADEQSKVECTHSDDERAFWGTWATLELYAALDLGYQLLQVIETWHYERWAQYDGKDPDSGLFTQYINCFLKLKQEASGWPAWVKTEADKEQYIKEYEREELDGGRIAFNAGLRQLSKLCLNSFWGKFGQRNNLTKTAYFTDIGEYFKLILDSENEVRGIAAVNDNMVCVTYKKREEFIDTLPNTNMLVAVYTTCHARLKLYSYLHELGPRCLYFDTDSVIYTTRDGEASLPTGDCMGELSDELSEGSHISEFVGAGPKQYAFKVVAEGKDDTKYMVKVRGFNLNCDAATKINFDNMKRMVKAFVQYGENDCVEVYTPCIVIKRDKTVATRGLIGAGSGFLTATGDCCLGCLGLTAGTFFAESSDMSLISSSFIGSSRGQTAPVSEATHGNSPSQDREKIGINTASLLGQ